MTAPTAFPPNDSAAPAPLAPPSPLASLSVVLVKPKFPENIGAAARALANFGCPNLVVVAPRSLDQDRMRALATPKGAAILAAMRVEDTLDAAVADCTLVYGTTARLGGQRRIVLDAAGAAAQLRDDLAQLASPNPDRPQAALVFGPEEIGLTNEEARLCTRLVTIPTDPEASSLNLAQAVVVLLYECFKAFSDKPPRSATAPSRPVTHAEMETLVARLKTTLLAVDFLKPDNPDYFLLPIRRLLNRIGLRRSEFNLLMGAARQIDWALSQRNEQK